MFKNFHICRQMIFELCGENEIFQNCETIFFFLCSRVYLCMKMGWQHHHQLWSHRNRSQVLWTLLSLWLLATHNIRPCQGCLCHVVPNFQCPPPPHCCESGMYTYDECGCCLTCAKSELQPCGVSNGQCAKGLQCLKPCG